MKSKKNPDYQVIPKRYVPSEADIANIRDSYPFAFISIYWNDLTPAKQAEILEAFGDNRNFDVVPIAELPLF